MPSVVSTTIARLRSARQTLDASGTGGATAARLAGVLARIEARLVEPPRAALLGEFNAGKSSLANLILGRTLLPAHLLANSRLPTRVTYAPRPIITAVGFDGRQVPVKPAELQQYTAKTTQRLNVGLPLKQLTECVLIDMPGLNDPNLPGVPIEWAASHAHITLWCTAATQAWKSSEVAAWTELPRRLRSRSLLVVTHADSLRDPSEGTKVLQRLRDEAGDLFAGIVLLSVTQAAQACDDEGQITDPDLWRTSGGEAFAHTFLDVLERVTAERCKGALRAAQRMTTRELRKSIAEAPGGAAAQPLAVWYDRTNLLADALRQPHGSVTQLAEDAAASFQDLGAHVVEPWLRKDLKLRPAAEVLSLLPREPEMLLALVNGLPPAVAAEKLSRVVSQVREEVEEVMRGERTLAAASAPAPAGPQFLLDLQQMLERQQLGIEETNSA